MKIDAFNESKSKKKLNYLQNNYHKNLKATTLILIFSRKDELNAKKTRHNTGHSPLRFSLDIFNFVNHKVFQFQFLIRKERRPRVLPKFARAKHYY